MAKRPVQTIEHERMKVFNNIMNLTKNINSDGMIYLTKDLVMTGTFLDVRYEGIMYSEVDTSMLHIEEGTYYLIDAKECARDIKNDKLKKIDLSQFPKLILTTEEGHITKTIKPISVTSDKFITFQNLYNKYSKYSYLYDDIVMEDKTEMTADSLDSNIPVVINIYDEHSIRFIKKMIRVTYTRESLEYAKYGIVQITEHLYILKIRVSINKKDLKGNITHIYAVVPF